MILCCIPVLRPKDKFSRMLEFLSERNIKTLILDSGNNENLVVYKNVIYEKITTFRHSTSRNKVLNYEANYYLFLTEDVSPYNDFIDKLLYSIVLNDAVVAYARQIPYPNAHPIEKYHRTFNYPITSIVKDKSSLKYLGIRTFYCSNSCALYDAKYFKKLGGFSELCDTNEDFEFAFRAINDGKKIAYSADAIVYHSHDLNTFKLFKRYYMIGNFFKKHPYILELVKKYERLEETGRKYFINELEYTLNLGITCVIQSFYYTFIKFMAYKTGYCI